jgi:hypothetical protein
VYPKQLLTRQEELDKGNIANALTDDFMEDVGITQNQLNVGQQLMSLGIVLFEFPSNMVLYRVGPAKWLTLQMFLLVSFLLSSILFPLADTIYSLLHYPTKS